MCQLGWQGNVSPCNLGVNMDLSMGNIRQDSLADIYYSGRTAKLSKRTGYGNDIVPCKTCTDSYLWDSTIRIQGGN